ncbi:hypothetical protein JVT61DRAFT_7432 [Boletus reticuloceps]|uniref:Uncharacterized protein n=1 Tax=Boletus reticuloceps TaxID=495285 RepID=A0A8I2YJ04_9AGAM|nr:hypothetical protein JVT61DRAFT_7432 [Boletus reticuloceps]
MPQQQVFYSLSNVLRKNSIPEGYALLRMLKCYLELDALIGLDAHTERMLLMIESELLIFNDILKEYVELAKKLNVPDLKVEWRFPKVHLWKQVVCDIRLKGVSRNFSTWPNESMHGALREAYNRCSNGRDVAAQILCVDQHTLAIKLLRQLIDSQNCLGDDDEDPQSESDPAVLNPETNKDPVVLGGDVPDTVSQAWSLGSPCKPVDMQILETHGTTNRAFSGLHRNFTAFLNSSVHGWGTRTSATSESLLLLR